MKCRACYDKRPMAADPLPLGGTLLRCVNCLSTVTLLSQWAGQMEYAPIPPVEIPESIKGPQLGPVNPVLAADPLPEPEPVLPVLRTPKRKLPKGTGPGYSPRTCRCCRTVFKPDTSLGSDCQTCLELIPATLRRFPGRRPRTLLCRPAEWFERSAHAAMLERKRDLRRIAVDRARCDRRATHATAHRVLSKPEPTAAQDGAA